MFKTIRNVKAENFTMKEDISKIIRQVGNKANKTVTGIKLNRETKQQVKHN